MAKQKGIVQLEGTVNDLNFYKLNGKIVVRRAGGGFTSQNIKNHPNMERIRENGSEFGHCSRINKVFRQALLPFYEGHRLTLFHSHLMSLFIPLKNLDSISVRGERRVHNGIATAEGKRLLPDFQYTPDCNPIKVLPFDVLVDWSANSCSISGISIKEVPFITGASHIRIQFGVLDFDFESSEYKLYLAPKEFLSRSFSDTDLTLSVPDVPEQFGTRMAVLGVRYYQEVSGELYPLGGQNAVGIRVCSVF